MENCKTVTVEEAARALGISRNSGYAAAKCGEIPTIRIGRRLLVPRVALDRLLSGESLTDTESQHEAA